MGSHRTTRAAFVCPCSSGLCKDKSRKLRGGKSRSEFIGEKSIVEVSPGSLRGEGLCRAGKGRYITGCWPDSGQCFFAKVVEKRGRGSSVATGKGGRPFIRQLVGNEIRRCFGTIAFAVG